MSPTLVTVEIDHKGAAKSVRFSAWTMLTAMSIICLIATVSAASPPDRRSAAEKWAIAVCSLSFIFALVGTSAYLFARAVFLGTILEVSLVGILLALWSVGLPTIMNPNHGIAVQGTEVDNANVYFFSWGCFGACLYMVSSLAQELRGLDVTTTNPKTVKWFALMACGLIIMGNSVRIFKAGQCATSLAGQFCRRTKFSISVGVIGFFFSFVMVALANVITFIPMVELGVSLLLLIVFGCGTSYSTFGRAVPGHAIGNLYFASWISVGTSVLLFSDCLRELMDARAVANADPESQREANHTQGSEDDLNDLSFTEN